MSENNNLDDYPIYGIFNGREPMVVDWLYKEITENFYDIEKCKEALSKARQMENEKSVDDYRLGYKDGIGDSSLVNSINKK